MEELVRQGNLNSTINVNVNVKNIYRRRRREFESEAPAVEEMLDLVTYSRE